MKSKKNEDQSKSDLVLDQKVPVYSRILFCRATPRTRCTAEHPTPDFTGTGTGAPRSALLPSSSVHLRLSDTRQDIPDTEGHTPARAYLDAVPRAAPARGAPVKVVLLVQVGVRVREDVFGEEAREGGVRGAADGDAAGEVGGHPDDDVCCRAALECEPEMAVERVSALGKCKRGFGMRYGETREDIPLLRA